MNEAAYQTAKFRAGCAVAYAVRTSALRPAREFKCVDCGRQASCYDHRDYSKPLDVEPVCRSCNRKRGRGKFVVPSQYPRKVTLFIRTPVECKKQIASLARKNGLTISSMASILLEHAVTLDVKRAEQ